MTNTAQFIQSLRENNPNLPVEDIATIAHVSVNEVEAVLDIRPNRTRRAPSMGATLHKTSDQVTDFERRLKAAGEYRTLDLLVSSLRAFTALEAEANEAGDYQAAYAVSARVLTLYYRACMSKRHEAAVAFSRWLSLRLTHRIPV